jgi:hypothetical protein
MNLDNKRPASKDTLQRRCPRLGSMIFFSYCRTTGEENLPCFKIFDCWWEHFDVVAYLQNRLSPEEFQRLRRKKPPAKINNLLDLVQQARQRLDTDDNSSNGR